MSSSAITTQVAQLKIGNVQNQADSSSVYSNGVWSFKNSTALTSVTITDAGAVTLGPSGFTGNHVVNGNVGIGTASKITGLESFTQFTVSGSNGGIAINSTNTAAGDYSRLCFTKQGATGNEGVIRYNTNDYHMGFFTNATERMRIDASGSLIVGSSSSSDNTSGVKLGSGGGGPGTVKCMKTLSGGFNALLNYHNGSYVGGINFDNTSTSFPTSSDVRLKKDIVDAPAALDKMQSIRIVSHGWKHDDAKVEYGVVAQELFSVAPQAVTKGDVGEEIEITWTVDYSKLTPMLVKAIQEQQAQIEALKAEVAALKAQP